MSIFYNILFLLFFIPAASAQTNTDMARAMPVKNKFALAIHGGAGNITKNKYTPAQEAAYKKVMNEALELGYTMLSKGAIAIDAVEAVIKVLEDDPLFNAGKGSVFTNSGTNEMDASIMDGSNLKCGAVTNVRTIKNPISAAKRVMNNSPFVFLSAKGAEQFAKENGLAIVDTAYFFDEKRWHELLKMRDSTQTDPKGQGLVMPLDSINKFGTVGCVVLDSHGNLAAGTSTGGMTNKKYNRIGDSPIIGAGTYANNKTCAVSCTGRGEDFIRIAASHTVHALMMYQKMPVATAADKVINEELKNVGGMGGLIAMDHDGNITFQFNTGGMFRGSIDKNGKKTIAIYK